MSANRECGSALGCNSIVFCLHTAPEKVGSCCVVSSGYSSWKRRVLEINSTHVVSFFHIPSFEALLYFIKDFTVCQTERQTGRMTSPYLLGHSEGCDRTSSVLTQGKL